LPTPPTGQQKQKKRTFDVLLKTAKLIRYRQCPLLHKAGSVGGEMAFDDFAGLDRDDGFMPAIGRKEMRRRVIDENIRIAMP
jgi:hypothetical protein